MTAGLRESFAAWWRARAPRERSALAGGAAVLLPLLLVFGLALPATERIRRLEDRSSVLERQLSEMRAMQAAMKARGGMAHAAEDAGATGPADAAGAAALSARLESELAALPGFKGSARVAEGGVAGAIDITVESAPFDALVVWLERVQKRERLFVAEAKFTSLAEAGRVGGRIRLARGGAR
jgi:general secretion pathway protein M